MSKKISKKEARKLMKNGFKKKKRKMNLNVEVLGNEIETNFLKRVEAFANGEGNIVYEFSSEGFIYQLEEFGLRLPIPITDMAREFYDFEDEYEIQEAMFLMQVVVNNTLYEMDCCAIEVGNNEEKFLLDFGCCLFHYLNNIKHFRNAVEKFEKMNFCHSTMASLGLDSKISNGKTLFV